VFEGTPDSCSDYSPISAYALISDCHSSALVSVDGSIDWCCFDRFDARPVFARLLDWSRGGHFRICPDLPYRSSRRYLPRTNVLETRFETETGVLSVTDCFAVRETSEADEAEAVDPYRQLIRIIACESGEVPWRVEFNPRFDYGLTIPQLRGIDKGLAQVCGGADALVVQTDLEIQRTGTGSSEAFGLLRAGERAHGAVTYAPAHKLNPVRIDANEIERRLEVTLRFWTEWSERCTHEGPHREAVLRSALVLKGLTNAPTGALVAAPTTSLPERFGGVRNWDYRYTWLRDSAFMLYALFSLGYRDEASAFMRWLERTTAGRAEDLQVLYGVGGERLIPEHELTDLHGYRGSSPVRIGNAATTQFQLDIYGAVVDTAWLYIREGGELSPGEWEFVTRLLAYVQQHWAERDEGIWEVRGPRRHFVYSKVMAWVAVDRALRLARRLELAAPMEEWKQVRKTIRQRIDTEGVDPDTGAFVQAFGDSALDASALLIPEVHYVRHDDPRVRSTLDAIERELCVDGLVYRYRNTDDGLTGGEGAFVICSFWLVDNLIFTGQVERARERFETLLGRANDVGLLAEQIDPRSGAQLGNFPQAFSHMGLINSAVQLERAPAQVLQG
jgi:GH15 family glucan-1,4-alpha-glucosidase